MRYTQEYDTQERHTLLRCAPMGYSEEDRRREWDHVSLRAEAEAALVLQPTVFGMNRTYPGIIPFTNHRL